MIGKHKMVKSNKLCHWKPVHLEAGVISNGVEGLVGIEELAHYELKTEDSRRGRLIRTVREYDSGTSGRVKKKKVKNAGPLKKRKCSELVKGSRTGVEECGVSKRSKKGRGVGEEERLLGVDGCDSVSAPGNQQDDSPSVPRGMEAWSGLNVPDPVLRALSEQGFMKPTKIQALSLPPAIFGRRDILGAAETGSGKTLAFGIPIIYGILIQKMKESTSAVSAQARVAGENGAEVEASSEEDVAGASGLGCVRVVDNISAEQFVVSTVASPNRRRLYALVLTPTRELAIQVKNHLVAAAKYTDIKVAVVVGGMAPQKQERVLRRGPEIVVATPGRLWELLQQGNPHLMQVTDIRYLAVDETDRMVEKGHFQEVQQLLELLNTDTEKRRRRQNFVFSATLTLVHEPPRHVVKKKRGKKPTRITPGQKLNSLIEMLGITDPKVVDVTNKTGTAELLFEACIYCDLQEKDLYLFYLLQKHVGRTLVFCNSIGCVRRLAHLLGLLRCQPLPLHANMMQRQRLKNLDRFRASANGLLLATDVAARGLDIPGVEHVIHYQVPRTSESYVHRSGRTARAQHAGITILLVEPSEVPNYARLCRTLGRDQQLPHFPVVEDYMMAVKQRVQLATEVDKLELDSRRTSSEAGWLHKAALEMDILLDDDDVPNKRVDEDVLEAAARRKRVLAFKRKQLAALLEKPIFPRGFLANYPTLSEKQQLTVGENALEALSASLGAAKNSKKKRKKTSVDVAGQLVHRRKHRGKPRGLGTQAVG